MTRFRFQIIYSVALRFILTIKVGVQGSISLEIFCTQLLLRCSESGLRPSQFGDLDPELELTMAPILQLSTPSYAELLLQFSRLSRQELLARFQTLEP